MQLLPVNHKLSRLTKHMYEGQQARPYRKSELVHTLFVAFTCMLNDTWLEKLTEAFTTSLSADLESHIPSTHQANQI